MFFVKSESIKNTNQAWIYGTKRVTSVRKWQGWHSNENSHDGSNEPRDGRVSKMLNLDFFAVSVDCPSEASVTPTTEIELSTERHAHVCFS